MNKRNGFTLIELIAVIVLLGIIALIAVPITVNIVKEAKKKAFESTARNLIKSANLYYSRKDMLKELDGNRIIFNFPNDINGLDIQGKLPDVGEMIIKYNGEVGMAISNGRYCIIKDYKSNDLQISKDVDNCEIPWTMKSEDECIYNEEKCKDGVLVNVKVNDNKIYDFYVISDTGTEVTMIMNQNLGENVYWITQEDFFKAGGTNWLTYGNNEKGPITTLNILKERTSEWTNVPEREFVISDDSGRNRYSPITMTMRARLLTMTEAKKLGCTRTAGSCPHYLYMNLLTTGGTSYGYYFSSASEVHADNVWRLRYEGKLDLNAVASNSDGIRPVITLIK